MDKNTHYSNVAFGGDWSESTLDRDHIADALTVVEQAVRRCCEHNPRGPELDAAIDILSARTERGPVIADGLRRAFANPDKMAGAQEAAVLLERARNWTGFG